GFRVIPDGTTAAVDRVGITSMERGIVAKNVQSQATQRAGSPASSRNKRQEILTTAIEHFGRDGYEYTKWADIAADVGVGSTALYHYFESKLHCLFEIMSDTLQSFRTVFDEVTQNHERFEDGFAALLHANFDLTEAEISRCRVLVAEQGRLSQPRTTEREEEARQRARARTRDIDIAWSNYLSRGMATGAIPEADPQLLTRATLGLYNSVWHWYRPRGTLTLAEVEEFYVPRMMLIVGLEPSAAAAKKSARRLSSGQPARPLGRSGHTARATPPGHRARATPPAPPPGISERPKHEYPAYPAQSSADRREIRRLWAA